MQFPTPTMDDNVVHYELHLRVDVQADEQQQCKLIEQRLQACQALAEEATTGFLWHRHSFRLDVQPVPDRSTCRGAQWMLAGETSVGDAIQDEWVVVWLLRTITQRFDDLVARVWDTDGEFLLIECADVLPWWLTPENSDFRVFLRSGRLHVIPPSMGSHGLEGVGAAEADHGITRAEAIEFWWHRPQELSLAGDAMLQLMDRKLQQVLQYMRDNRHSVQCVLPAKAAVLVQDHPEVVGAAVEAFYYREPKAATFRCKQMRLFPVEQVTRANVVFTRCMYAQLKQQQFHTPKPFERSSQYSRLNASNLSTATTEDRELVSADIGMKLTCGLELLGASRTNDQDGNEWGVKLQQWLSAYKTVPQMSFPTTPSDDDSWLYLHPDSLEETLKKAAGSGGLEVPNESNDEQDAVGGAEELQKIASMFNNFMTKSSEVDGVDTNDSIKFDVNAMMALLRGEQPNDFDDSESEEDEFGEGSNADSEDDEYPEDELMRSAMDEMEAELAESKLAKSFVRPAPMSPEGHNSSPAIDELDSDDEVDESMKPLDINFNLLSNLLESFASQEGNAGPVTSMLGEMGFQQ
ncbi:TPA: hypothetical protein N0F65_004682 [Lagenidium giganteum]|uniref:Ecdysoneless n=1 Tax=Lagenidium giganteum TaxID=4803 RepID=A0AAV2Z5R4_9STRA|nr:TPA: hypothetical protein N0F65_004682 [Lagenidium giganteum]